MKMQEIIHKYLESNRLSWSPSTLKSEHARLHAIASILASGNPEDLWRYLEETNTKPYTRLTTWTRAVAFYSFGMAEGVFTGPNKYALFREKNKRLFKNVYTRRLPDIGYEEAYLRISTLPCGPTKTIALLLLSSGLRFHEAFKIQDNAVVGKGGKKREIFLHENGRMVSEGLINKTNYSAVYRTLKQIGLTPHMLRKLCLSRLVEKGANVFELCEIAGWSNLQTASSYIKTDKSKLQRLMSEVQKV